ncbi:Nramp family divalent metal transporter [bacterium SCSIO 12643]|nr:Nramp family divalent metal transporter [bacterium SCSIO 12643]
MTPSLEDINKSIDARNKKGFFRKLFAFMGPAYLISVGYMDPGNWATDIAGGAQFGYKLIWVLVMSNIIALLLQSLSARLGIVRGRDLAQASREEFPKPVNLGLYVLAEIAIASTDLAEVLGMAIGLNLLFDIPLLWGVVLTLFDTFLLLFLINKGMRRMEAFILALIGVIGASFFAEMIFAQPHLPSVMEGFIPSIPNTTALFIAIGIIGATVMPHNLYLHSSLVQTRNHDKTEKGMRTAIKFNILDTTIALNLAFFVNAAILILAAATFYNSGMYNVSEIEDAYKFLEPMLGTKWAPILFAVALIAAGQSSTLTGTLAGQIVMEGYLNLRFQPWVRRIITRVIAIVPAVIVILIFGEGSTGTLLIVSQVILSLQLGFAVIPLIHHVSDKSTMGTFAIGPWTKLASWSSALVIVALNIWLVIEESSNFLRVTEHPVLWGIVITILAILTVSLLVYVTFVPIFKQRSMQKRSGVHQEQLLIDIDAPKQYNKIAVAVDFSTVDNKVIQHVLTVANKDTEIVLIHIVESVVARVFGDTVNDSEAQSDEVFLENYKQQISAHGYKVHTELGYGNPKTTIPQIANSFHADLLVLGSHGHGIWADVLFGTTIDAVRHKVEIPVFIVRE